MTTMKSSEGGRMITDNERREGGREMSEKKYLLSERDLKCLFHSAWDCMISESNVVEFVKAREYQERTCQIEKSEFADFAPEYEGLYSCPKCGEETAVLACVNEGGDMEWVKPRFCGFCGAKVVEVVEE